MKAVFLLALGGVCVFLAACSGETAIVLEIHKAPGVSSEVKALRIFAGVGHDASGDELIDPAWWLAAELDETESSVALGDEMGASTYRYLARPGGGLDTASDLMFAVAGYKNASDPKPVVFGHSASAVRFGDGEVRVYDFPLDTFTDARHGVAPTGCVWWDDEAQRVKRDAIAPRDDGDCDAYAQDPDDQADCMLDCKDRDPSIHPGQSEICADGVDQNCCDDMDGLVDLDGDGFAACGTATDCVDLALGTTGPINIFGEEVPSDQIHPEATEVCDGVDNDCVGGCDEKLIFDPDGDGYLNCRAAAADEAKGVHRVGDTCESSELDCLELPRVGSPLPSTVHPDALDDTCDGWDQNCDGGCDEVIVAAGDQDGDSFPACTTEDHWADNTVPQCRLGLGADCGGDASEFEYPGRAERCDGVDFDCDTFLFPALSPCFVVETGGSEPHCRLGRRSCNDTPGAVNAGFGVCALDANGPMTPLPMSWCDNPCAQATDPAQCLIAESARCQIPFENEDATAPCPPPPPDIPLPADAGPNGCNYLLVGAGTQGDWQVTLVSPTLQTGSTAMGCGSFLRVVSALPDAEDRVVLVMSGSAPHLFFLKRDDQCSAPGTPLCTMP